VKHAEDCFQDADAASLTFQPLRLIEYEFIFDILQQRDYQLTDSVISIIPYEIYKCASCDEGMYLYPQVVSSGSHGFLTRIFRGYKQQMGD